ncbi:MAG: hypothetical protein PHQ23_10675, partial [Candidatus Wallbacteria bacterium]|nr:hypothetical protein [Candidatus Wallbacteria bacterium]
MRFAIIIIFLTTWFSASAFSDKKALQPSDLPDSDRLILGYGATTLDGGLNQPDKLWYEYRIKPRVHARRIWLGLDLTFHVDEQNRLRSEDWDGWEDILDKLDYLYYNTHKDPYFLRLGRLHEVTFGTGFLVNRYSNATSYPLHEKKVGLDLGVRLPFDDGVELLINDLDAANLYGFRAEFVPLDLVTVGLSYIQDSDPERNNDSFESLHFLGIDVVTPVFKKKTTGLYVYENLAKILDYGLGFSSGLKWEIPCGDICGEYRYYDSDFSPSYFNEYYELDGRRKYYDLRALRDSGKFGGYF